MSEAAADPGEEVKHLQRELACSEAQLKEVRAENEILRQKLDALVRRIFGSKSEQLSPDQFQLLFREFVASGPAEGKRLRPGG